MSTLTISITLRYVNETLLARIPATEVFPVVEDGNLPAKATAFEAFPIRATVFREGHDCYAAEAVLLRPGGSIHSRALMRDIAPGLDRYEAWVMPDSVGQWSFRIDTWSDPYATWRHDASVKIGAGVDVELMLEEGALLMERATSTIPRKPSQRAQQSILSWTRQRDCAMPRKLPSVVFQLVSRRPCARYLGSSPSETSTVRRAPTPFSLPATALLPVHGTKFSRVPTALSKTQRDAGSQAPCAPLSRTCQGLPQWDLTSSI